MDESIPEAIRPVRWHRLIGEALSIRDGKKGSGYWTGVGRMLEAVKFLGFMIQTCNS